MGFGLNWGRTVFEQRQERKGGKRDFWAIFKGFNGREYVIICDFTGVAPWIVATFVKKMDSPKVFLWQGELFCS